MTYETLFKQVDESFSPRTSSAEIERALRRAVALSPFDRARVISLMAKRVKVPVGQLDSFYRGVAGTHARELKIDWTVDDREHHVMTMGGSPIFTSPNPEYLNLLWQYPALLVQIHELQNPKP
jgi:hypothetical protein